MNKSRKELFGANDIIDIAASVSITSNLNDGVYKCSILYNKEITEVKFAPYQKRKIESLKLVNANGVDYAHKYADRSSLNKYLALKGNCDEVLLVKKGLITDTSFTNIVFFDGSKWLTPKTPLLKGTKREKLLAEDIIAEENITPADLKNFEKAGLINCMLDIGDTEMTIDNIVD